MNVNLEEVKKLREETGAGVLETKQALAEASGDYDAAMTLLRQRGQATALKKQERVTREGLIGYYIHPNMKVAALVEIACETDFVSRTEQFQALAHDLAMQVAAANPLYLRPDEVPAEVLEHEREVARGSVDPGKPASVVDKIIQGKLEKFYSQTCLLRQQFIKDDGVLVEQLVTDAVAKFGENIQVGRFVRFQL